MNVLRTFFMLCVAYFSTPSIPDSQEVSRESIEKISLANNELALKVHRELASNSTRNIFFSPLSISMALGMLFYGTKGDTAQELINVLGYEREDLTGNLVHLTIKSLLGKIFNSTDTSTGLVVKAANAVLVDKRLELLDTYRNNVIDIYKAVVREVDFSKEAPKIVEEMNSWVREKTDDKIEKIFDDLSPSTFFIILSALYFKGTWKTQFDPGETTNEIFFNNGLEIETSTVPMMHMTSLLQYDSTDNFQILELPFKGGNVNMLIFLPNELNGLHSLEASLTPEKLAEIQEGLEETKVDVSLPRFKLDFDEEFSEEIQALGGKRIFDFNGNFSGMTLNTGIFVSEIRHKAIIEVNEEGSEAAAVTGNLMERIRSPLFRVDHPFFFTIFEKSSNMILFIGRVNNL